MINRENELILRDIKAMRVCGRGKKCCFFHHRGVPKGEGPAPGIEAPLKHWPDPCWRTAREGADHDDGSRTRWNWPEKKEQLAGLRGLQLIGRETGATAGESDFAGGRKG